MKILIVCSGKPSNPNWNFPYNGKFIYEQAESLKKLGVDYDTYFIEGKGILGYLRNYRNMIKKIDEYTPELVHAHYGLSGLLATFQRQVPVIVTFHGDDINDKKYRIFSLLASLLSTENIFVHKMLAKKIKYIKRPNIIACGVDKNIFFPIDKKVARKKLGLDLEKKYALFTSPFSVYVKNAPLAQASIAKSKYAIELIELTGYSREEVCLLMNAVDFLLITSHSETGPLVAKEALCCHCPIVSVDVGDVKKLTANVEGCYISPSDSDELAKYINRVIEENMRIDGSDKIEKYTMDKVAKRVLKIYQKVLKIKELG